jgi:hypothetical protein
VKHNSFNDTKKQQQPSSFKDKEAPTAAVVGVIKQHQQQHPTLNDNAASRSSSSTIETPKAQVIVSKPKKLSSNGKAEGGPGKILDIKSDLLTSMRSELHASRGMHVNKHGTLSATNDDNDNEDDADKEQMPHDDDGEDVTDDNHGEQTKDDGAQVSMKFDFSGSEAKARLVLQDATLFELNSMYRKTDKKAGRDGIALQMGRREDTHEEQVVAVIFDKEKITQAEAQRWWDEHQHRFVEPSLTTTVQ